MPQPQLLQKQRISLAKQAKIEEMKNFGQKECTDK
jgi:hypothetical protein